MQCSRGSLGHSKHRKACVHGKPMESSKGQAGPMPWFQKFLMQKWANSRKVFARSKKMYASIQELFERRS
jgi:hypothetical protein